MRAHSILLMMFLLTAGSAGAATLFEGFYRIERNRQHVGFGVQRLRQDGDKRILSSYYRFKRPDQTETFESYQTVTRANGEPISSEHHGNKSGLAPNWARFTAGYGRVDFVTPNSRRPAALTDVKLLSSALFLVADLPKLALNHIYRYRAFSEDHGNVNTGTLHVVGSSQLGKTKVLRLLDDYNGEAMEHFVSASGQPLGSRAYAGDFTCYWVASRESAIDVFRYPNRDVIAMFGDLPTGTKNDWSGIEGLDADQEMRKFPKWRGQRVRTPAALAKASPLPTRSL